MAYLEATGSPKSRTPVREDFGSTALISSKPPYEVGSLRMLRLPKIWLVFVLGLFLVAAPMEAAEPDISNNVFREGLDATEIVTTGLLVAFGAMVLRRLH